MKKIFYLFICLIFLCSIAKAITIPSYWVWSHNFNARIHVITYHNDFLYTAGTYSNGPFIFSNVNLPNNGSRDVVIMKWDTLGNMIWAKNIYGTGHDTVIGIKVNSNNELVIAGSSNSAILHVDGVSLVNNSGNHNVYMAKYDLLGNNQGAFIYNTATANTARNMCIDYNNAVYIASDSGISKYGNNGMLIWQQNLPDVHSVNYSEPDSSIVICGNFYGNLTKGNTTITAYYGVYGVQPDIYLLKLTPAGSTQWLKNLTNDARWSENMRTYVHDSLGKIFIAYFYQGINGYTMLLEVSSQGTLSVPQWNLAYDTYSIDGKGAYVSFGHHGTDLQDLGYWDNVYNIYTQQTEKVYDGMGFDFQCFRRMDAIYTCDGMFKNFGKVGGGILVGFPTLQNRHKCLGAQDTLTGNIVGGVGALNYSWSPATGLNNTNTNSVIYTVSSNISYTLTVTDAVGHIEKDTFNIFVDTLVQAANITSSSPAFCADSMVLYSNTGVEGFWRKQNGINWNLLSWAENRTIYSPGKYSYYQTNACGSSSDTINILPAVVVSANAISDSVCVGQSATLTGSGALNYAWSGGVINNIPFVPAVTQSYTVTGTDANGCTNTSSITVTVNPPPSAVIYATPPGICDSGNALLSIYPVQPYCIPTVFYPINNGRITNFVFNSINNFTGVNGGPYTYYNMGTSVIAGNTYPVSVSQNSAGQRKVWIDFNRDGDFVDAGEQVFSVNNNIGTVTGNIVIPANACNGKTRMRVACGTTNQNFSSCTNNSNGEYEDYNVLISGSNINNVTWSPNTFLNNTVGTTVDVINLNTATTYTVSVADAIGCSNTGTITLNVYPNTTSYTNASICINQIPYSWAGLSIDSPGIYTATIPNANGCDSVATLNLNISLCGLCQPSFTVNWTPFTDSLVESQTWIMTSGTVLIPVGAKVKYDANAGGYVRLNPGFKADSGAVFVAQAYNGCTAGVPQLPIGKIFKGDPFVTDEIVLYPNPTTGLIHIQHNEKLTDIQIFDMVGKLVINQKCQGETETSIDLSNVPNGIYHVRATGYNSIKVVKNN